MLIFRRALLLTFPLLSLPAAVFAAENIILTEVPDYTWYAGCFGTASGNLMGYWDRHGFPNFYTGPTAGGVAPLDSGGSHEGIRSLWASRAGFDGRPADQPGHIDDYWDYYLDDIKISYESTSDDPYVRAGRPEHAPDCLGDFLGISQKKWADLDGECSGNIDAFSFNFWDKNGQRRTNFVPPPSGGIEVRDVQSGLRAWTQWRGEDAEVFSQEVDFNPNVPPGNGFTFADLKAEIDAGYPVLLFLQNPNEWSRSLAGMPRANPEMHGMLAYGYFVTDDGSQLVRYRTSWGSGDNNVAYWAPDPFEANLPVRGVIGFHPLPKITGITRAGENLSFQWEGPASMWRDNFSGEVSPANWYVIEKSDSLSPPDFHAITLPASEHEATITAASVGHAFFRVRVLTRAEAGKN